MQKTVCTLLLVVIATIALGQNGVEIALASVSSNNKALASSRQYLESQRLQNRVGLAPANPDFQYDYLFGKPANMGNQTDIQLTQSFDFPTAYRKKGLVANGQDALLDLEAPILRQRVLLDAKLICMEVIYLNKLIRHMETRVATASRVDADMTTKLQNEEVSAIEANKAKLVLLNARSQLQLRKGERDQLQLQLAELNGGTTIDLPDTSYPAIPLIPNFDALENSIEANDPHLKHYEQQIAVSEMQIGLTKAMALPKLETGYHYQSILGQTFNGVHLGMTIPLWANKNTVQQTKAYALYTGLELEQFRTSHLLEVRGLYQKTQSLTATVSEYESLLTALSSQELLKQSFELEQLSFIEYALETQYYNNAVEQYLQLEMELHLTVAKLFKHNL